MPFDARQVYSPCCLLLTDGKRIVPFTLNILEPVGLRQVTLAAGFAAMTLQCKTTSCPSNAAIADEILISGFTIKRNQMKSFSTKSKAS